MRSRRPHGFGEDRRRSGASTLFSRSVLSELLRPVMVYERLPDRRYVADPPRFVSPRLYGGLVPASRRQLKPLVAMVRKAPSPGVSFVEPFKRTKRVTLLRSSPKSPLKHAEVCKCHHVRSKEQARQSGKFFSRYGSRGLKRVPHLCEC